MIHLYAELALWLTGFYFAGCLLGAGTRRWLRGRRDITPLSGR